MSNFKIGDRVAKATKKYYETAYSDAVIVPLFYDPDEGLELGEVIKVSDMDEITVKWDRQYNKISVVDSSELMTEEAGKSKYSELESEFQIVKEQITLKVKEIAEAISEADKLSRTVQRPLASMGYDIIDRYLYSAMDEAGWNTSSFGC